VISGKVTDFKGQSIDSVSVFLKNKAFNEPLKGRRLVEVTEFKTKNDWAKFINRIADEFCSDAKKH